MDADARRIRELERGFRRDGLPNLIVDLSATDDIFTRAIPFLTLVFMVEAVNALDVNAGWANPLLGLGGAAVLLGGFGLLNMVRGRRFLSVPQRVGIPELVGFVTLRSCRCCSAARLYRHLATCDLAVVQGGLTTCMELVANRRPFLYFPLAHHFEQNFHVAHRLDRYRAGRRMDYATSDPDAIAAEIGRTINCPSSRDRRRHPCRPPDRRTPVSARLNAGPPISHPSYATAGDSPRVPRSSSPANKR